MNTMGDADQGLGVFSIACAAMNGVDLIKYEITIFSIACAAMNRNSGL